MPPTPPPSLLAIYLGRVGLMKSLPHLHCLFEPHPSVVLFQKAHLAPAALAGSRALAHRLPATHVLSICGQQPVFAPAVVAPCSRPSRSCEFLVHLAAGYARQRQRNQRKRCHPQSRPPGWTKGRARGAAPRGQRMLLRRRCGDAKKPLSIACLRSPHFGRAGRPNYQRCRCPSAAPHPTHGPCGAAGCLGAGRRSSIGGWHRVLVAELC
jgi:hypothetical protein